MKSPFLKKFHKSQSDQLRESCRGGGDQVGILRENFAGHCKTLDGCLVTSNLHFARDDPNAAEVAEVVQPGVTLQNANTSETRRAHFPTLNAMVCTLKRVNSQFTRRVTWKLLH